MAIEQDKLGLEVYKILSAPGYGYNLSMYDSAGQATITPLTARWIYVKPQNMMFILPEQDKPSKPEIYLWKQQEVADDVILELIQRLRILANQFGVGLTVNDFAHNDAPKAFAKAAGRERAEAELQESYLAEGLTGSAKRSYLQLENARMVVVHSKRINEDTHGSRSRNVKEIFVECNGERYRYPTKFLPGARSMTRHMSMGGSWGDRVGKTIRESGTEIKAYRRLVVEAEMNNAPRLVYKANQYLKEVRSMTQKMQGVRGYIRMSQSIMETPIISKKYIQNRSIALGAISGLTESPELMESYKFLARRDIMEDMNNLDIYTRVIQEAMIDISPNVAKRNSRCLIKGNLGSKAKMKSFASEPKSAQHKTVLFADALSEAVDNEVISITLSEIAEKASPTAEDAKFVSGVYKTLRMNEYVNPINTDATQELLESLNNLTNGIIR